MTFDPALPNEAERVRAASDADWPDRTMTDELVAWGRIIELETTGRRSGQPRRVAVGYVERTDGSVAIAATDPDTQWALNLLAEPRCRVRDEHGWRDSPGYAPRGRRP